MIINLDDELILGHVSKYKCGITGTRIHIIQILRSQTYIHKEIQAEIDCLYIDEGPKVLWVTYISAT